MKQNIGYKRESKSNAVIIIISVLVSIAHCFLLFYFWQYFFITNVNKILDANGLQSDNQVELSTINNTLQDFDNRITELEMVAGLAEIVNIDAMGSGGSILNSLPQAIDKKFIKNISNIELNKPPSLELYLKLKELNFKPQDNCSTIEKIKCRSWEASGEQIISEQVFVKDYFKFIKAVR